jgi:hypothetical protein
MQRAKGHEPRNSCVVVSFAVSLVQRAAKGATWHRVEVCKHWTSQAIAGQAKQLQADQLAWILEVTGISSSCVVTKCCKNLQSQLPFWEADRAGHSNHHDLRRTRALCF